ncbi:MAG: hypothetical protein GWN58_41605 [Anaerolineae bacterium]|nr:hypothetical protein [Anaerolineae bacterium]
MLIMQCPNVDACQVEDKEDCPHFPPHAWGEACDYTDEEHGCPPCEEVDEDD